MKLPRLFVTATVSLVWLVSSAQAQLVFNVDSAAETLWFTGSDSGTTSGGNKAVAWFNGSTNSLPSYDASSLFTNSGELPASVVLDVGSSGSQLIFSYSTGAAATTITGKGAGTSYDYSGWTVGEKSTLEGLTVMSLTQGTDFDSVTVSVSAVPEPSTYASLMGLVAMAGATFRRRRHRA